MTFFSSIPLWCAAIINILNNIWKSDADSNELNIVLQGSEFPFKVNCGPHAFHCNNDTVVEDPPLP